MSNRSQATTIIGVGIICMTIVSFVYIARSNTGQPDFDAQLNYHELQSTHAALTKQYESLYEYKERLEKAYLNLKNEKATLLENGKNEKVEFTELKELYSKQVQTLQDDLKTCHDQLHAYVLSSKNANTHAAAPAGGEVGEVSSDANVENNELYKAHEIAGAALPQSGFQPHSLSGLQSLFNEDVAADPKQEAIKSPHAPSKRRKPPRRGPTFSGDANIISKATPGAQVDNNIASNVLKEPIQSPIAQVPMEPAQPSSDPNQDLVGNVFI